MGAQNVHLQESVEYISVEALHLPGYYMRIFDAAQMTDVSGAYVGQYPVAYLGACTISRAYDTIRMFVRSKQGM